VAGYLDHWSHRLHELASRDGDARSERPSVSVEDRPVRSGGPPEHWLAAVRERVPGLLLQPGEEVRITHDVVLDQEAEIAHPRSTEPSSIADVPGRWTPMGRHAGRLDRARPGP